MKIKKKPLFSELYKAIESYNEQQVLEINSDTPKIDVIKGCNNCEYRYLKSDDSTCRKCFRYNEWIKKKVVNNIPKTKTTKRCNIEKRCNNCINYILKVEDYPYNECHRYNN